MSRARTPHRQVRIQATGPFFELDFTVPEKKAATELRRLKRIQKSAVKPLIDQWRFENKRKEWRGYLRGYVTIFPRMTAEIAHELGIKPTTITTQVI